MIGPPGSGAWCRRVAACCARSLDRVDGVGDSARCAPADTEAEHHIQPAVFSRGGFKEPARARTLASEGSRNIPKQSWGVMGQPHSVRRAAVTRVACGALSTRTPSLSKISSSKAGGQRTSLSYTLTLIT